MLPQTAKRSIPCNYINLSAAKSRRIGNQVLHIRVLRLLQELFFP